MKLLEKILFNVKFGSPYVRALWKTRLFIPVKVHGIKVKAWKVSQNIKGSLLKGTYESSEIVQLTSLIQSDERILELGTGLGVTTCLAAKLAQKGFIWTFEADPDTYGLALNHFELNHVKNVEAVNGIIGKEAGEVHFYVSKDFWESSTKPLNEAQKILVKMMCLDDVLGNSLPSTVVMDIEGAEYELLLLSSWRESKTIKKIIVEFHAFSDFKMQSENLAQIYRDWNIDIPFKAAEETLKMQHLTLTLKNKESSSD